MKRIAIQYSGEIRNFLDCINNHYETFIIKNPNYQVDIFAHLWIDNFETDEKRKKVVNFLNAKKIVFETRKSFKEWEHLIPDPRFPHPIENTMSMFYGIEKVNEIRKQYAIDNNIEYDIVVRLRTDLLFISEPCAIKSFDNYDLTKINIKEEWAHIEYGVNDQFAFGPTDLMDKYLSVYSNLPELTKQGASAINPECLLGYNANVFYKLPIAKSCMRYWIYNHAMIILGK